MLNRPDELLTAITQVHRRIRDDVIAACEQRSIEYLSQPVGQQAGDTIFTIDRIAEDALLTWFDEIAKTWPCVLIAEGVGQTGVAVLPSGVTKDNASIRIIVDPIDGTRGLMYQKRSAWILTGVAANFGEATSLSNIEMAIQTEIPIVKQHLSDVLWAIRGGGVHGERYNRLTGELHPIDARPSKAKTIAQGYGQVV